MLTVFKWSLLTKCNLYTLLKDSFKSVSSPGLFVFDLAQAESVHILHLRILLHIQRLQQLH